MKCGEAGLSSSPLSVWALMGLCLDCWDTIFKERDQDLWAIYKTDVVDCHPFNTAPPISFEDWKAIQ